MSIDKTLAQNPNTNWYDLVEVMVHELTHATMYQDPTNLARAGEYVAYQVGEDYLDSVASGYWSGADEKAGIENHISSCYPQWSINLKPTDKWWSYA